MKLIKPSYKIIEQGKGLDGVYKHIELISRTCYKSEDKITEDSAKGFVERMMKSKHEAMLEHSTIYLYFTVNFLSDEKEEVNKLYVFYKYRDNKYSRYELDEDPENTGVYISTNLRVLTENGWLDDLKYMCEPIFPYHKRRITVKFTCDRGVSHEFVRHRVFSFAQESTRYCNYSKDKFGGELTYIIPNWTNLPEGKYTNWDGDWCDVAELKVLKPYENDACDAMLDLLSNAEFLYTMAIDRGWTAQQARAVLPNAAKTELVMTGFVDDWKHFFDLRAIGATGAPHPQAKELAEPLMNEFIERKYIE